MSRRVWWALCGLLVLGLLAGCTGFGGATSESDLAADASYDWETETDAHYNLGEDSYAAIYQIENRSSIRVYQSTRYGTEHPLPVRAVQFRHTNGTVVGADALDVSESRSGVTIDLPAEHGQLAFTASKRGKEFTIPVFFTGSHSVEVPPGYDVRNFILGTVRPRGADVSTADDRVYVSWNELSGGTIRISYYLPRDLYLLGGLIGVLAVGGLIAIGIVYRQILLLRREREELGLDIDMDEDSREPPPGMR